MDELDEAMARVRATYSPTEGDKHRLRAALGTAIAGSVLSGATAANGAITAGASLAKSSAAGGPLAATGLVASTKALVSSKLVAAVIVGSSLTAGGAYWLNSAPSVEVAVPTPVTAVGVSTPQVADAPRKVGPSDPEPEAQIAEPELGPARPVAKVQRSQPAEPSPVSAEPAKASSLVLEAQLIGDASKALRDGNGARALQLLAEHAARYPNGALRQERQGLRALGLCATGQVSAAREAGRSYLKQSPDAPLAAHVKKGCE